MKCVLLSLLACVVLAADVSIDGKSALQEIDGFGFSSAWCGTLNNGKLTSLFGTLGMSILRIRIDENYGWTEETTNTKNAHSYGAIVLGSPWSPPPSWKSGGYLMPSHYADYADYLNQASTAIGFDYVSIQNEPDYGTTWTGWTAEEMYTFMKNYSSVIKLPIVFPESFQFVDGMSDPVLNDSTTVDSFAILGGHLYGAGNYVHTNALSKGKKVWMTEHYIDGTNDIKACLQIAEEVSDTVNNLMSAYIWWWVYDTDLNIQLVTPNGTINKNGYTLGQWSKFVKPGAMHIGATYKPASNVWVTAYYSDNEGLTIVAVNANTAAVTQTFTLSNLAEPVTKLLAHRTSPTEGMTPITSVSVSGNTFTYTLTAQSITTLHEV